MAEKFSKTSLSENNIFNKGMYKDLDDVYLPEGSWINAINAINNSHEGETGTIGNEPSNKLCVNLPYDIIGIVHKEDKKWILFSTNGEDSEIGEFDEIECSYVSIINDKCLNFSKEFLITGVIKEISCTWHLYWQDGNNPDRYIQLDDVPHECIYVPDGQTETVTLNAYTYKIITELDTSGNSGNIQCSEHNWVEHYLEGPSELWNEKVEWFEFQLGNSLGDVQFDYESINGMPVRFEVIYRNSLIFDSGYVGDSSTTESAQCVAIESLGPLNPSTGSLFLDKNHSESLIKVKVTTNCKGHMWKFKMGCPPASIEPPVPSSLSYTIPYTDLSGNQTSVTVSNGSHVEICARLDSIINPDPSKVTIIKKESCGTYTETITGEGCNSKICTERIDCDKIKLNPPVTQPCVTIRKSKGPGQLATGSYMACIAYSESGIKLTDYTLPSVPQSLFMHVSVGGSIEVIVKNLDHNYQEYQLVVIATVNGQTYAKKIGEYSVEQELVSIDSIHNSLEVVPIQLIPLRSIIYTKSDRMSVINNYLIRSGVATQHYINYQPLANNIRVSWQAVEYDKDYYRDGGHNVGHMRDEVYSYFIRWIYDTGNITASYHIPGRAAVPSDLYTSGINADDKNGIQPYPGESEVQVWQVYDTSTIQGTSQDFSGTDGIPGKIIAFGEMGFWQSTEKYPTNEPPLPSDQSTTGNSEIWGDLCGKSIRHHKMPSNKTIHHHNNAGNENDQKIIVLGVSFSNIERPKDNAGNYISDIVGYEILRGSREGNKSIIAKGIFNNMRVFHYDDGTYSYDKVALYQNYPYNDLRFDRFLVHNPDLIYQGSTSDEGHLTGYSNDIDTWYSEQLYKTNTFSFHSPETAFIKPYIGEGAFIKLYKTEIANINGKFEYPYKHPKHVLITNGGFLKSALMGLGIALMDAIGSTSSNGGAHFGFNFIVDVGVELGGSRRNGNTLLGNSFDAVAPHVLNGLGIAGWIGGIIGFILEFSYHVGKATDDILRIIRALNHNRQYALQFNSHGVYDKYESLPTSGSRDITRIISKSGAQYIGRGIQNFNSDYKINNLNRNKFLCVELEDDVPNPTTVDNTRQRLKDLVLSGSSHDFVYSHPTKVEVRTLSSSHYGAIKFDFQNQYGQLRSINQIPINSCVIKVDDTQNFYNSLDIENENLYHGSRILFGGDTYINRYTEKNPYMFFHTWMFDIEDETGFDYRDYINGGLPRYWANLNNFSFEDFDIGNNTLPSPASPDNPEGGPDAHKSKNSNDSEQHIARDTALSPVHHIQGADSSFFDNIFTMPDDFHRLDNYYDMHGKWVVKYGYFYLSYNGVRDFFVESELDMSKRDWGDKDEDKFYDVYNHSFDNISKMFRTDIIDRDIYLKYDMSLSASKLYINFSSWGRLISRDYNPSLYETCFEYLPKRSIYSLQNKEGSKIDKWRNFLPLNIHDFKGRVSTIKSLNATGSVILFEDAEPVMFRGVDTIQTDSSVKFTIGDAGLFNEKNLQSFVNADDTIGYGHCISSRSAINTPYGLFWISQDSGKIFNYSQGLDEISNKGMKFWFSENLPSWYRKNDKDYKLYDNPVAGTGCQAIYDPTYELIYFTKKGYIPKKEGLKYDSKDGVPYTICQNGFVPFVNPMPNKYQQIENIEIVSDDVNHCLTDYMLVVGSSFNGGGCTNPNADGYAQKKFVKEFLLNPTIQYGLTNHKVQVGIAVASNTYRYQSATPQTCLDPYFMYIEGECGNVDFFRHTEPINNRAFEIFQNIDNFHSMKCTWDVFLVEDLLEQNWLNCGVSITKNLQNAYNLITATSASQLGDRSNFVGYNRVIIYITDGQPLSADDNNTLLQKFPVYELPNPGQDYQSSTLGGNAMPHQFVIGVMCTQQSSVNYDDSVLDKITFNQPDYQFKAYLDLEYSFENVINQITNKFCVSNELSCSLQANVNDTITEGEYVELTWYTGGNIKNVYFNGDVVYPAGIATVLPLASGVHVYTLVVEDYNGNTKECIVDISVQQQLPITDGKCPCPYDDERCFEEVSWTISYDPKTKTWLSFHDWIPELFIPSNLHFNSIKDNSIWKHNDSYNSYCNYYGKDYPWEVEYSINTKFVITTLRSIEYYLDVYKYSDDGKSKFHMLDSNFDEVLIYNTEQISGNLKLNIKGKNEPAQNLNYPTIESSYGILYNDILFSKEENKYRFNQFWDITLDRGEFSGAENKLLLTSADGVHKFINTNAVDYFKNKVQRKKFRHYNNKIILRKLQSKTEKMILKIVNSKNLNSSK